MKRFLKEIIVIILICASFKMDAQWISKSNGLNSGITHCFVELPGLLVCGGNGDGIFASADTGNTWTASNSGILPGAEVVCFGKHPAGIFAGSDSLVYFSTNSGASWNIVNSNGYRINAFAFLHDTLFAATVGGGVLLSTDIGVSWTPVNSGITSLSVNTLLAKGNLLYAGTVNDGIFVSSNAGASWTAVNNGLTLPMSIGSLETDGSNIYAGSTSASGSSNGMFVSSNNGALWVPTLTLVSPPAFIVSTKCIGNAVLTGAAMEGVYRSLDSGATWSAFNAGLPPLGTFGAGNFYELGSYVFCGIESGGNGSVFRIDKSVVLPAHELSLQKVRALYPNPTHQKATLEFDNPGKEDFTLLLYDHRGNLVQNIIHIRTGTLSIDTRELRNGIYSYQLKSKNKIFTGKLEVQHNR